MKTIVLCLLGGSWIVACSDSHDIPDPVDGSRDPVDGGGRVDATLPRADGGPDESDGDVATPDARPPDEDGGAAVAGRILCGTEAFGFTECDAATEGCLASCLYATDERMPACVAFDAEGRFPVEECPTGREMFPRYWLTCDGAEDCAAGELCHMVLGSTGQFAYCDACEPPCDLASFNVLCRSAADCPTAAPRCEPTDALPGYATCVSP